MDNSLLTLQHLETLSSADLIALADDYGIDIPDNLNRRFIIGELLEIAAELQMEESAPAIEIVDDDLENASSEELPFTFNETQISVVLRNPAWAFVYWDISEAAVKQMEESMRFESLILRTCYFENEDDVNPIEFFDVQIDFSTRQQYILLENNKKYLRMDLVAIFDDGSSDNLCISRKVKLPALPAILTKAKPGEEIEVPELLEISGMKKLLKNHYEKYRQSFME
ncbi:MAG: DUF4912 domain-containing protein [Treponema sp.]|nr:DUF4912 domain-containing protein [Candidatus Treponema equifaecale]